jgi:predicted transcriptional regulator of viral defense system
MDEESRSDKIRSIFRRAGGVLRTSETLRAGIHSRDLYALRDAGELETISRGVYRLADLAPISEPDLATVALRVPNGVIAVISALHFHGLTTEIPHKVSIALPRGASQPALHWPPLHVYRFSEPMYSSGIQVHERDGIKIRVYSAVKTVADCFRLRNRLGVEIALEGLRNGLDERAFTPAEMLRAAKVCRVDRVVRPYLEALQ